MKLLRSNLSHLSRSMLASGAGDRRHAVDKGRISLKEVNGELERFSGLLLAWLNAYDRQCERPGARKKVFVSKVRGFTFGGSWRSPSGDAPTPDACAARYERPPCLDAAADGCEPGHAWPPNMTRPVHRRARLRRR